MLSPRMAYVLLWFPLSSETFVFREIQQLVQRGMDIRVYTMYGEKLRGCSDEMKNYTGPIKRFGSVATLRLLKAFWRAWKRDRETVKPLLRHARVEVAHAAGVQLDDLCAGFFDGRGVNVGVDVGLHDADAELVLQRGDGGLEGRGLAAAGGGHEVEKEGAVALELFAHEIGLAVVAFKYALFYFQNSESVHN